MFYVLIYSKYYFTIFVNCSNNLIIRMLICILINILLRYLDTSKKKTKDYNTCQFFVIVTKYKKF